MASRSGDSRVMDPFFNKPFDEYFCPWKKEIILWTYVCNYVNTMCSLKIVFFSQFIVTHPLHVGDRLVRVYSHSYWLAISRKTNNSPALARGRGCKVLKILGKKPQYLKNTLYIIKLSCRAADFLTGWSGRWRTTRPSWGRRSKPGGPRPGRRHNRSGKSDAAMTKVYYLDWK